MPPIYKYVVLIVFVVNLLPLCEPIQRGIANGFKHDDVVENELKLKHIKPLIPAHSVVGYITDGEITENNLLRLDSCRLFYMTQYALAPIIVMHETKRHLVVGNFSTHEAAIAGVRQLGLAVVKDCDNGIMLLEGKAAP
jgi:hypothetical protein